jgi:hypothetical protein
MGRPENQPENSEKRLPVQPAPASSLSNEARLRAAERRVLLRAAFFLGQNTPWDNIEKIASLTATTLKFPPEHPKTKQAEIRAKIAEIHGLARELLQETPKAKSRRGPIQPG